MTAYVCSTCRTRLAARITRAFNHQHRQRFSRGATLRHTGVEDLLQRHTHQQREDPPQSQIDTRTNPRTAAPGRYSSRALGPEELLQQLEHPNLPAGDDGYQDSTNATRRRQSSAGHQTPRYTRPVARFRSAVIRASAIDQGVADEIRPALLDALANEQGLDSLLQLRTDRLLGNALGRYTAAVHDRLLKTFASHLRSAAMESGEHTPAVHADAIMLLRMCLLLNVNFRHRCGRPLWVLARDLSMFYSEQRSETRSLSQFERSSVHLLMSIWNLCMANTLMKSGDQKSTQQTVAGQIANCDPLSWSFLPGPDAHIEMLRTQTRDRKNYASLQVSLSLLSGDSGQSKVHGREFESASSALLTLDVLQTLQRQGLESDLMLQFQPWMDFMTQMVDNIPDRRTPHALNSQFGLSRSLSERAHYKRIVDKFRLKSDSVRYDADPLLNGVNETMGTANPTTLTEKTPGYQNPVLSRDEQTARHFTYLSIKRLGRSLEQQDVKAAERVKVDVVNFNQQNRNLQLPLQLYEHLLLTFLSLRRFQTAVDCWTMMLEAGHAPTVKTYSIVIRHSRNARNTNAMDYFWNQMRNDGLQPDVHTWSARLFGLFHKGQVKMGLAGLSQMGQEWLTAARAAQESGGASRKVQTPGQSTQLASLPSQSESEVNGVPKPNVYAMNAAIGGVISAKIPGTVPEILAWGRKLGIEPDVVTYNYLIQSSMQAGKPSEAVRILHRMKEKNIETNDDTWTILISSMFGDGSLEALAPPEQEEKVLKLIKLVESDGANIGEKAYAVVLDRFLKQYNNINAAQATLAHMASKGIALNQYQCTIVMTAYFQQTPPDFAAIENLWSHMKEQNNGRGMILGSQFYDRMIEGYATHHKVVGVSPMLTFLTEMESRGLKPSWRARTAIARALAERKDWDRLLQMVSTVRQNMRAENVGGTTTGQHDFWEFIISTGLLRDEGITDVGQITAENMAGARRMFRSQ